MGISSRGWKDSSAVKNMNCPYRRPRFYSQHPYPRHSVLTPLACFSLNSQCVEMASHLWAVGLGRRAVLEYQPSAYRFCVQGLWNRYSFVHRWRLEATLHS